MKRVRFAPAPSGFLHAGNARIALLNYLYARHHGMTSLLRFDDSDKDKIVKDSYDAIKEDLAWLGLVFDAHAYQSRRGTMYEDALHQLAQSGRAYRCYESADELTMQRRLQAKMKKPPRYNRAGLALSEDDHKKMQDEGKMPHWRFLLSDGEISWTDGVHGAMTIRLSELSDPVIQRSDGTPLYILTSVVDDAFFDIAHVIRGSDHLVNTAAQLDLARALNMSAPAFSHVGLVTGEQGTRLSKRDAETIFSLRGLRNAGYEAMSVNNLLAGLGSTMTFHQHMDALAQAFSFDHLTRAAVQLSLTHLDAINERLIRNMSFDEIRTRLKTHKLKEERLKIVWEAIRDNIKNIKDMDEWIDILEHDKIIHPSFDDETRTFLQIAHDNLPSASAWHEAWELWQTFLQKETGRKGGQLMLPLRLALTGRKDGPSLSILLFLLGYEKVSLRLKDALS